MLFLGYEHSSAAIGLHISLDYWWTLYGLDNNSPSYDSLIKSCHQRAANRLHHGCVQNGGLYVKLGQGLAAMNHILPEEYVDTLHRLEDQALNRRPNEVSPIDIPFSPISLNPTTMPYRYVKIGKNYQSR